MLKTVTAAVILTLALAATPDVHAATVITKVSEGQQVTLPQLTAAAERSDLVMIGEVHDKKNHHDLQLGVIRSLWEKKVPLAIGLEMFAAGSQQELDQWSEGKIDEESFKAIYARNWSYDWALYRDIFIFARDNKIPMLALNIPKDIATKVARQGCASLTPEEKTALPQGANCDLNTPHTAFLEKSFKQLFQRVTNGRIFTSFCEAQTVRNSGMAMNVAGYLKKRPGAKVVAISGVWHAVKNAVPEQLHRYDAKYSSTVILPAIPELNRDNASADVVDYMVSM
jgi:uncharacterized iron-regulated protein